MKKQMKRSLILATVLFATSLIAQSSPGLRMGNYVGNYDYDASGDGLECYLTLSRNGSGEVTATAWNDSFFSMSKTFRNLDIGHSRMSKYDRNYAINIAISESSPYRLEYDLREREWSILGDSWVKYTSCYALELQ